MAFVQEFVYNAVAGLKAEALSAAITSMIALLMWFVVLPVCNKSKPKKVIDAEPHETVNLSCYNSCLEHVWYFASNGVTKGISGLLTLLMLARVLKMAGAFENPSVILPTAFLLGGLMRWCSSNRHEQETVDYPENDNEDMIGDDACHHSEAFWSNIGQPQEKMETQPLSSSEILADVLLPLISDSVVAPVLKAGRRTPSSSEEPSVASAARNSLPPTASCIASATVLVVCLALLRYAGDSCRSLLVLPMAFLLGGLSRFIMSPCSSDTCNEFVEYPDVQLEESCDDEVCHHSAAFWGELEHAETKEAAVAQPSEILSNVLLGYLEDPVVSSIFMSQ